MQIGTSIATLHVRQGAYGFQVDVPGFPAVIANLFAVANLGTTGQVITARNAELDFVSRCFVPGAGIPKDPVTGSIHATLVPYWAEQLGETQLRVSGVSSGWSVEV